MESKKYKEWIKPGIYSGLQRFSIPLFGILSTVFLAHLVLPKEEMGVWAIFLTISAFVEILRAGIVKTSMVKFMNYSAPHYQNEIFSSAFILNAGITLLLMALCYFGNETFTSFLNAPGLGPMLNVFLVSLFLLVFFSHFEWVLYGKLKFREIYLMYLVRQGSTLLAIIFAYFISRDISLVELAIFYTIGILLGTLMGYFLISKMLEHRLTFNIKWTARLFGFGKYVLGTNTSAVVFRNADQIMLSNITANTAMVASQNIAMRVINIADIPSQVIGDILFPKSSDPDIADRPEKVRHYYEKAVGVSLSFAFPFVIFALIFPKFIIWILAGSEYYDAIPYLRLICFSTLFLAYLKQWGVIIDSTGRPQLNFYINLILAAVQIGLCYFFIERFALLGAAYALLCAHVIGFVMTQMILHKLFGINFINCIRNAFHFYPEYIKLVSRIWNKKWRSASTKHGI